MAAYGERGVLDRPKHESDEVEKTGLSQGVTWRMSLDWEVLGTYQPGEMPMPSKPKTWADENASGDEQRGDLVWFTTESSCATKRGRK